MKLCFVVRDDQFAAPHVRHVVLRRELVHEPPPVDAQTRFQGSRRVVNPGMDHPAVMRAGVLARARVPFEHAHGASVERQLPRRGEPGDPGSDYCDVDIMHTALANGFRD